MKVFWMGMGLLVPTTGTKTSGVILSNPIYFEKIMRCVMELFDLSEEQYNLRLAEIVFEDYNSHWAVHLFQM